MKLEKMTEKTREALYNSSTLAKRLMNPEIKPEHLFLSLIDQQGGIVPEILNKLQRRLNVGDKATKKEQISFGSSLS